jgi:hypothetical protein
MFPKDDRRVPPIPYSSRRRPRSAHRHSTLFAADKSCILIRMQDERSMPTLTIIMADLNPKRLRRPAPSTSAMAPLRSVLSGLATRIWSSSPGPFRSSKSSPANCTTRDSSKPFISPASLPMAHSSRGSNRNPGRTPHDSVGHRREYRRAHPLIGADQVNLGSLLKHAATTATQIGVVIVNVGDNACKIPLATESLAKIQASGRAVARRRTIRCCKTGFRRMPSSLRRDLAPGSR